MVWDKLIVRIRGEAWKLSAKVIGGLRKKRFPRLLAMRANQVGNEAEVLLNPRPLPIYCRGLEWNLHNLEDLGQRFRVKSPAFMRRGQRSQGQRTRVR